MSSNINVFPNPPTLPNPGGIEDKATQQWALDLSNTLQLYLQQVAQLLGSIQANATIPAGYLLLWGGATIPTGYLLCNGAAVSRVNYATLFTAIGTRFGAGDGSTTFNVPNITNFDGSAQYVIRY